MSQEQKDKISDKNKGKIRTEEMKRRLSESHKGKHHSEETNLKISAARIGKYTGINSPNYGKHLSEETKNRISESLNGRHLLEETKRKISESEKGKIVSDETRELLRLNHTYRDMNGRNNPMYGVHLSGEKSGNWKGGISFEPYCLKFNNRFKEKIRNQFGRQCFICGMSEEQNNRKLCVHHVNYNKDCLCNDIKCYFVPLCNTCHIRTNSNRQFWEKLLTDCCEDDYMMIYFDDDKSVYDGAYNDDVVYGRDPPLMDDPPEPDTKVLII